MHPRGFGFADFDEGDDRSAFVPPGLAKPFMSGDRVTVTVTTSDPTTASGIELVERTRAEVFGVVERDGRLRVDPHTTQLRLGFVEGQAVGVGEGVHARLSGDSLIVLERFDDPESGSALRRRALVRYEVEAEVPEARGASRSLMPASSRRDLRSLDTFTIDADSSQDLDDALSVLPADSDGALRVFIHIADVAEHVPVGSPCDLFARKVATSVYLPDWNRPMLPRRLSEDELSLLPGVDRDAVSAELRIDAEGNVSAVDLVETRICSNQRLSYDVAAQVLAGDEPEGTDPAMVETLRWLRTAAARLSLQRARRGGVESRRVEPELAVALDDRPGSAIRAVPAVRTNDAHTLIEHLMVAANEAVAEWMRGRGLTTLYRRHDTPGAEAGHELESFAQHLGFYPGFGDAALTPLSLAAFDAQLASGDPVRSASVWNVLIKHLGRARYTTDQGGHFGLGSTGYVHFTSPIRRYADLTVQRIVKAYLQGERGVGSDSREELEQLAGQINVAARAAARAETDCRKAMWLSVLRDESTKQPGKRYQGRVSGVANRGVFVTLEGSLITGMVGFKDLPGGPWHVEGHHVESSKGRRIEAGELLTVSVAHVDLEAGMLDLSAGSGGGVRVSRGSTAATASGRHTRTEPERAPKRESARTAVADPSGPEAPKSERPRRRRRT